MRKISLIFNLVMTLNTMINAQTFYNGSFEDVTSGFPNNSGQINKAVGWQSITCNNGSAIGTVDLIGNGFYNPYWGGPGAPTPQQILNGNIPFDYTRNKYIGFYANSELTQNILISVIPANKIFKIRFKFGYSDRRSDGGQSFQTPNQWHTYESEWLSINKNITTIAVGGFGGCENDRNDYIYMDDIEIITAGTCPTCIKMNEPLIPGNKMNFFTPDMDGHDDILYHEYENMTSYDIYVTDRWNLNHVLYCAENQWPAITKNGLPAVAWDGSRTNQNCKRIGGQLNSGWYLIHYKVRNCSNSYQINSYQVYKAFNGNNGNAPGLFPADPQYWACCVKNYHIQNQTLTATPHASSNPDLWYRASEWIIAENSTVKNGAGVRFTAGNEITLLPGFTAEAGANFEAYIQSCATQKTDFQPNISENIDETLEDSIDTTQTLPKPTNSASLNVSPNPFSTSTTFNFSLPASNLVHIRITDALGVLVYESKNQYEAGKHSLEWDANKLPSGVYFVQFQAGAFVQVKKIVKN